MISVIMLLLLVDMHFYYQLFDCYFLNHVTNHLTDFQIQKFSFKDLVFSLVI